MEAAFRKQKQEIAQKPSVQRKPKTGETLQPGTHTAQAILQLQRSAGNSAAAALLGVQRKLTVGAAHDRYEQEAERTADRVMNAAESRQSGPLAAGIGALAQRAAAPEEEEVQASRLQRSGEDEDELQTSRQRSSASGEAFEAGSDFENRLNAQKSGGQPLPGEARAFMESRFGADFGGVRVHADSGAAQLNREVSAQAFTRGEDIYMGAGKYDPGSEQGRHLLAHELTHVIQQTGTAQRVQRDHKDTGLKKDKSITAFSQKIKDRVSGKRNFFGMGKKKEWKNLTAQQRADKLLKYVNAELKNAHVPPILSITLNAGGSFGNAAFDFQTWTIGMDDVGLDQDLTENQVGELGDTIYHESRHAEQWFRMARLKAGEGLDAAQIAAALFIPNSVAKAAEDRPLKAMSSMARALRRKQFIERQDAKLQEAMSWYDSVYGANSAQRNLVLGDIGNHYDEYRALSEEVDAWGVGGAASAKIKALLQDA